MSMYICTQNRISDFIKANSKSLKWTIQTCSRCCVCQLSGFETICVYYSNGKHVTCGSKTLNQYARLWYVCYESYKCIMTYAYGCLHAYICEYFGCRFLYNERVYIYIYVYIMKRQWNNKRRNSASPNHHKTHST